MAQQKAAEAITAETQDKLGDAWSKKSAVTAEIAHEQNVVDSLKSAEVETQNKLSKDQEEIANVENDTAAIEATKEAESIAAGHTEDALKGKIADAHAVKQSAENSSAKAKADAAVAASIAKAAAEKALADQQVANDAIAASKAAADESAKDTEALLAAAEATKAAQKAAADAQAKLAQVEAETSALAKEEKAEIKKIAQKKVEISDAAQNEAEVAQELAQIQAKEKATAAAAAAQAAQDAKDQADLSKEVAASKAEASKAVQESKENISSAQEAIVSSQSEAAFARAQSAAAKQAAEDAEKVAQAKSVAEAAAAQQVISSVIQPSNVAITAEASDIKESVKSLADSVHVPVNVPTDPNEIAKEKAEIDSVKKAIADDVSKAAAASVASSVDWEKQKIAEKTFSADKDIVEKLTGSSSDVGTEYGSDSICLGVWTKHKSHKPKTGCGYVAVEDLSFLKSGEHSTILSICSTKGHPVYLGKGTLQKFGLVSAEGEERSHIRSLDLNEADKSNFDFFSGPVFDGYNSKWSTLKDGSLASKIYPETGIHGVPVVPVIENVYSIVFSTDSTQEITQNCTTFQKWLNK